MTDSRNLHEDLGRKNQVSSGSNRSFGLVFAAVFLIIGLWPILLGSDIRIWPIIVAVVFAFIAIVLPGLLKPLNRIWFLFGLLLHKIVSPIIMALLFYLTVTPMALLMRLFGKRPLALKFEPNSSSYWIARSPHGPAPETMKNQF